MANVENQVLSDDAANQALLAELLGEIGGDETIEGDGQEMVETLLGEVGDLAADGDVVLDEALLDVITAGAERTDAMLEMYAEQPGTAAPTDELPPTTTPEAAVEAKAPKKKGGGRKKKEAAAGEEKPAAEPKEPKAPRATSVTHNPGDLLLAKLGAKADEWLVFDSGASLEQIEVDRIHFIERMNDRDAIADKVREKINMFMIWMAKGGTLNEVLKRAITVLHADGQLTSGDKGNLQQNLLSKPYSVGTARSQANQMFMALPELQLTIKERGRMIPNPNSPLLAGAYAALGLA